MEISLDKKKIFISGCNGNLAKSLIRKFLNYNCFIYATSRNKKFVNNKNTNKNNKIKYFYLDFNDEGSVKNIEKEIKKIKNIDILINNSGINKIDEVYNIKLSDWNNIINVNVTGAFILTNLISRKMIKHKRGRILNISSIFGTVGKEKRASYSSSKWALIGLTKSSALDLAKFNILVNAISPGVIDSNLTNKILGNQGVKQIKKKIPLNKLAKINEIINVILFLVSDENSYMTGQNIIIDGGYTCG
jgi:3-oxoacyl-[acyl-carrier protein] reductase